MNPYLPTKTITIQELTDDTDGIIHTLISEGTGGLLRTETGSTATIMPAAWLDLFDDGDFRLILVAATRYALGRYTYMPGVVCGYLKKHLALLDKKTLTLLIDSVAEHLKDYGEHEPYPDLWHSLLRELTERRTELTAEGGK